MDVCDCVHLLNFKFLIFVSSIANLANVYDLQIQLYILLLQIKLSHTNSLPESCIFQLYYARQAPRQAFVV